MNSSHTFDNDNKINKYINNWLELNDLIKQENKKMNELYKSRQIIEQKIGRYNISGINNIKIYYTKIYKTLSQRHIKDKINKYFENNSQISKDDLYNFIISDRDFSNKLNIKKV
jgi:hypothetical protein